MQCVSLATVRCDGLKVFHDVLESYSFSGGSYAWSGMRQNRVGTTCALGNRLLVSRRVLECVIDRVAVSVQRVKVANSMYVCSADPCVVNEIDVR